MASQTRDVQVYIETQSVARISDLGDLLMVVAKAGESTVTLYSEAAEVAEAFGEGSEAHELAQLVTSQGIYSPATFLVATYDPAATEGIKTAAEAVEAYFDEPWEFVVTDAATLADKTAVANVVEGRGFKLHGVTVDNVEDGVALKDLGLERTFAGVHFGGEKLTEALIGNVGNMTVGTATWKNKTLVGITPERLTAAQAKQLKDNFLIGYDSTATTTEGTMLNGAFIDDIHLQDWLIVNGAKAIQHVLTTRPKVPYTDEGVVTLKLALENVFQKAVNNGAISITDGKADYVITAKRVSEIPVVDRAARIYGGLGFEFRPSGAIHDMVVRGVMYY